MVGKIRINNHYFEQGNIHFDLAKNYAQPVEADAVEGSIGRGIIEQIKSLEEAYQLSITEVYEEIETVHLKNLRRKLPITGRKFDWSSPKLI
jgi:hypothetical protein